MKHHRYYDAGYLCYCSNEVSILGRGEISGYGHNIR